MKRFAGTLIPVAILAALAGYYFLVDLPQEAKEREEKDREQRVVDFNFEHTTLFAYEHGDLKVRLEKKDGVWKLTEPLQVRADTVTLGTLVSQLEGTRMIRVVDDQPKDLAPYGLARPKFRLTVKTPELGEKTVLIGDAAPNGHSLYFQRAEEKRVLLVPGTEDVWTKSLFDFRDKTILDYNTDEVTALTLAQPEQTVDLKKENGKWKLLTPVAAQGDSQAIEDLLNVIRHARITAFEEEQPQDLGAYGLDAPLYRLKAVTSKEAFELATGMEAEKGASYAKRASTANVFRIPKKVAHALQSSYLELIDKQVLPLEEKDITRLELTSPQETIRLVRGEGDALQWRIELPEKLKADSAAVNSLLFDLKETRAKKFVTFGEARNFGLKEPKKTLTVTGKDGTVSTLTLGNPNLQGNEWFVSRSLDNAVFILEKETVDKLFRPLDDLRDRQLLNFAEKDAQRIRIERKDNTFELERTAEGWTLTQPERIENLKAFIGNDVLWTLLNLRFENELPKQAQNQEGFEPPQMTVIVSGKDGKTLARLVVGEAVAGQKRNFARVEGRPGTVEIADRILSEIPHTLEKFRQARES